MSLLVKCGYSGHAFSRAFYQFVVPYLKSDST